MFSQGWLIVGAVLVGLGLAIHGGGPFLVGLVLLIGAGTSYLSHRHCLDRVEFRRTFTPRRAFYGEEITLTLEITNRKPLPLAWLELTDELPEEVVPKRGRVIPSVRQRRQHLVHLFSLRWYERVRRRIPLTCTARGYFPLGPARVRSGDLFGITSQGKNLESVDSLIVYPKIVPLEALGLPALHPLGDQRSLRPLLEDPARTIGVRDYMTTDPLRRVHWKATARLARLQSRQYEATSAHRVAIFLNLDTLGEYAEYRGFVRPLLELNIMVAASVGAWANGEGYPVGLIANGYLPEGLRRVRIAPALGLGHLTEMLEALAKVFPTPVMPLGDLMYLEASGLPWGTTAVVITAVVDPSLRIGVGRLRDAGHAVVLVLIGDRARDPLLGVPVHRVRGEVGWRAMDEIHIA
ncbi:MAG: DUF58 domain-containing protein [Armatimonadetes bacterium]|nr:DUF58 domain-containing protein [Armatimonadota bacterium]